MNILMLDDDRDLLDALRELLARHDHKVDCCDNAKQAVSLAEQGSYDFIFVDYKMPDNDGLWFMQNVRLPRKTKTLLMTAYVNRNIINQMFAAGACGYIIKPFDESDLLRHLAFFSKPAVARVTPAPE